MGRKMTECGVFPCLITCGSRYDHNMPMSNETWMRMMMMSNETVTTTMMATMWFQWWHIVTTYWSQCANVIWNFDDDENYENDGILWPPIRHLLPNSDVPHCSNTHTVVEPLADPRVHLVCRPGSGSGSPHHSDASVDVTAYPHIPNSDQTHQIPATRQASRHQTPGTHQTAVVHGGEGRMENPDSSTADSSVKGASIGSDDWDVPETNIEMNPEHIEMYLGILRCTWCNFLERLPHECLDLKSCSWVHVPIFKPCTTFTTPAP